MKLITEHLEDIEVLTEAKANGDKKYVIEGIFMQAEKPNRNGRRLNRGPIGVTRCSTS